MTAQDPRMARDAELSFAWDDSSASEHSAGRRPSRCMNCQHRHCPRPAATPQPLERADQTGSTPRTGARLDPVTAGEPCGPRQFLSWAATSGFAAEEDSGTAGPAAKWAQETARGWTWTVSRPSVEATWIRSPRLEEHWWTQQALQKGA